MDFLQFIFKSFWNYFGFVILLGMIIQLIKTLWDRLLGYFIIRKHGYPPEHCNANGDIMVVDNTDNKNQS